MDDGDFEESDDASSGDEDELVDDEPDDGPEGTENPDLEETDENDGDDDGAGASPRPTSPVGRVEVRTSM